MRKLERRILTKHWGFNTLTIIAIFVYMGLHTWIQLELISLFDAVLKGEVAIFLQKIAWLLGLMVLFCIAQFVSQTMIAKAIEKMNRALRLQMNRNLANLSHQAFYEEEVGTYVSWQTNDVAQIEEASFERIFDLFSYGATCLFTCLALYSIHYGLLLTAIFSVIVLSFSPMLLKKRMQQNAINLSKSQEALVTVLEVDEQWIKISYQDKKKGEVTKIVRIERVEGIELLKE